MGFAKGLSVRDHFRPGRRINNLETKGKYFTNTPLLSFAIRGKGRLAICRRWRRGISYRGASMAHVRKNFVCGYLRCRAHRTGGPMHIGNG